MSGDGEGLPPLDQCLSAMDERIEFLSSALASLSDELGGKPSGEGGSPLAEELSKTKDKLRAAEAQLATVGDGNGNGNGMAAELQATKAENAALKAEIAELQNALAAKAAQLEDFEASARTAGNMGKPDRLQFGGLGAVSENEPKVITPTAMKKARKPTKGAKGGRRMSLMSTFKTESTEKVQRMEKMVELLTNISSVRETEALVRTVITGVFGMLAPEVLTVSLWVAQLNKTYTASGPDEAEMSDELASHFMKAVVDDPAAKVNVTRDMYKSFLGSNCGDDEMPQAVMCLPIFGNNRILSGVLEFRNAPHLGDYSTDEEELLSAITAQIGVSFENVLHNDRMHKALEAESFAQFDGPKLRQQIASGGQTLFEADVVFLSVRDITIDMRSQLKSHPAATPSSCAYATALTIRLRAPVWLCARSACVPDADRAAGATDGVQRRAYRQAGLRLGRRLASFQHTRAAQHEFRGRRQCACASQRVWLAGRCGWLAYGLSSTGRWRGCGCTRDLRRKRGRRSVDPALLEPSGRTA